jgi:hypothetical protein
VGVALAAAAWLAPRDLLAPADPVVATDGVRYSIEDEGFRYEFQAVLGAESLFLLADEPPRPNRIDSRADVAQRLRAALARSQGVSSVEALREKHAEVIEGLRRLGYL